MIISYYYWKSWLNILYYILMDSLWLKNHPLLYGRFDCPELIPDCRIIIVKNVKWLIFPWCISVKWCQNSDLLNTYVFIVHYCLELVNKHCIFPQILYFLMIHFESYHPESELSTISAEITKISVYMATKKWLSSTSMVNWLLYRSFTFLIMRDTSLQIFFLFFISQ